MDESTLEVTLADAPQRIPMTYAEYLQHAAEATIMEWVAGEAITYMPPIYRHQDVVGFLKTVLGSFVSVFQLGRVIIAPFEVKLWAEGPAREPDLVFISRGNEANLSEARYEGGPDVVVEVISRSSVTEDRVRKFTEYQQAGVREYWLIDPRPRQRQADFFVLDDTGQYRPGPLDDQGRFFSGAVPHFWLRADWFQQADLPDPQATLAEIMLTVPGLSAELRTAYQTIYDQLR